GVSDRIVDTLAVYRDEVSEYWYVNSQGTRLHELRPEVTLSGTAVARRDGTIEKGLESIGLRRGWNSVQDKAAGFREVAERAGRAHRGRQRGRPPAAAGAGRRDGRAADPQRSRDLVPSPADRAHDQHLHRGRPGGWKVRGPDRRREARGVRLRRVRRPDDARELLVHGRLRPHDP